MNQVFWRLTFAICIALLLPAMVQEGMFLDGVSYATIARNMAVGLGDFMHPHYTATLYPVCYEQPPLALWIQSLFFRLFGDYFWVERLFSCCMAALTGLGIYLNCRLLLKQETSNLQAAPWLSVLFWMSTSLVFWSYQNNMLECTMSVFVQFSVFLALKFVFEGRWMLLLGAAALSVCAVLCKGPVGLFGLIAPFFATILFHKSGVFQAAKHTLILTLLTVGLMGIFIWLTPGMEAYLDYYLNKQLLYTLAGHREKSSRSPLFILLDLVTQLALPAICLLMLVVKTGIRSFNFTASAKFCFALGLASSLPLILIPKQSAHYLLPAIPFFALGFAIECTRRMKWWNFGRSWNKWVDGLSMLILALTLVISISNWGKSGRDAEKIKAVKTICTKVGNHALLGIPEAYSADWLLAAYFARFGNLSLDSRTLHEYYLGGTDTPGPTGFSSVPLEIPGFQLWQRQ